MTEPTRPETTALTAPIVHPATGELVALDAPTDQLATWLDSFRDLDGASRTAKTALTDELARRLDHEGRASASVGEWKLAVTSPSAVKYDADRVYGILKAAADAGEISHAAAEAACPPIGKRKTAKRELDRLLAVLPPDRAAEIDRLAQPEARRITLTRLGGGQ